MKKTINTIFDFTSSIFGGLTVFAFIFASEPYRGLAIVSAFCAWAVSSIIYHSTK